MDKMANFGRFKSLALGIAVGVLSLTATVAHASTVQQLIHFDELTNNSPIDPYYDPDKNFALTADPQKVNPQSGNCAPSTNGGNGSCVIEHSQGQVLSLTHDFGASGTLAKYNAQSDDEFDFLGFYFELTGNGGACLDDQGNPNLSCNNFLKVEAFDLSGTSLGSTTWYVGLSLGTEYLSLAPAGSALPTNAVVEHNQGYFVDLTTISPFDVSNKAVSLITFVSGDDAQIRLDCIAVAFDGTTTQPYNTNTNCGLANSAPPLTPVPLPPALPLMASAFGILALLGRRKWFHA